MTFKSNAEAQKSLETWVKRLRLDSYDFHLEIARERDMSAPGRAGECGVDRELNFVTINLLDPEDYGIRVYQQDHEKTLVHELLHVILDWTDDYAPGEDDPLQTTYRRSLESTINRLADILVNSYRKKT